MDAITLIIALAALGGGILFGFFVRKALAANKVNTAENKAQQLLTEAKAKQKEYLLQAKDKAIGIIDEAKKQENERRQEINHIQQRLEKRETLFDERLLNLETKQQELQNKREKLDKQKDEIKEIKKDQLQKLEKVAGLNKEEAKNLLLSHVENIEKDALMSRMRKLEQASTDEIESKARDMLSWAILRYAGSVVSEVTTTMVTLPSDEMKGRIIGREGRNIRALENLTGTEVIVDDTPEVVTISGFSALRRNLAKLTLEKLMADGRIHPARIEETVEAVKKELAVDLKKSGEEALYKLGITGMDPKLVQLLGRLKYRTSYGQNQLLHSIETSRIAGMLAEELGLDVAVAKKGGLFHDIGKAVDQEVQGGHPEIGYNILKKFGMPEEVAYPSIGHHEDKPKTLECVIIKAADAISGARPGARSDTPENYVQRLEELEKTAGSFDGVNKAYAIQAGREVRVFVTPEKVDDIAAYKLAGDIAKRIEDELKYPGEIKITLIREKRVIEYAR